MVPGVTKSSCTKPEPGNRKIGYIVSRYPAPSHSFIRREINGLRQKGLEIHTFSVRRTPVEDIHSRDDSIERENTWAILPTSIGRLLCAHGVSFTKSPTRYLKTFFRALTNRLPGTRGALWAIFHFGEAILLAHELNRRRILHVHSHFADVGGSVAFLATTFLNGSWSQTLHGPADFDEPRTLLGKRVATARFTACISYFAKAQLMWASAPEHWGRIVVIRCGIELPRIPRRDSFSDPGRQMRVLTVGRLSSVKGHLSLIATFDSIVASGIDAELVIVGEGPERERLEHEIVQRELTDRVRMTGALSEASVLNEMSQSDVFVLSSFMEGVPVVLMEAMAVGVPVIAPRIAGIPELVEDGVTGYLFTPAHWSELSYLLRQVLTDEIFATTTLEQARLRVISDFNVSRSADALAEAFKEALSANCPERRTPIRGSAPKVSNTDYSAM